MSNVDVNDVETSNEPIVYDESINENPDEFFMPRLPDDGKHLARLSISDRGVTVGKKKSGSHIGEPLVTANLVLEILDPDSGETLTRTFDSPNSGGDKLQAVMAISGSPAPNHAIPSDLADAAEIAFNAEPVVGVVTQWQATESASLDPSGAKVYPKPFLKGQRNFPQREDGGYTPEVDSPSGELVRARAIVVRYFSASRF